MAKYTRFDARNKKKRNDKYRSERKTGKPVKDNLSRQNSKAIDDAAKRLYS